MIYRISGECEPGSGRIELPALACKHLSLKYAQPVLVKCYAVAPDLPERDAGSTPIAQLLCTATAASQEATGTEAAVKVDGSVQLTRHLSAGLDSGPSVGSSGTSGTQGFWCTVQPVQTAVAAAQHLQVVVDPPQQEPGWVIARLQQRVVAAGYSILLAGSVTAHIHSTQPPTPSGAACRVVPSTVVQLLAAAPPSSHQRNTATTAAPSPSLATPTAGGSSTTRTGPGKGRSTSTTTTQQHQGSPGGEAVAQSGASSSGRTTSSAPPPTGAATSSGTQTKDGSSSSTSGSKKAKKKAGSKTSGLPLPAAASAFDVLADLGG